MKVLFIFSLFVPFLVLGQNFPTKNLYPQPYQAKQYYSDSNSTGIKSIRAYKQVFKDKSVRLIMTKKYDSLGKVFNSASVISNGADYSHAELPNGEKQVSWLQINGESTTSALWRYNSNGDMIVLYNYHTTKGDTLLVQKTVYEYDGDKMVLHYQKNNNDLFVLDSFYYNNYSQLVKSVQKKRSKNDVSLYTYNNFGKLSTVVTFHEYKNGDTLISKSLYKYEDSLVVERTLVLPFSSNGPETHITKYSYYPNKKIKFILSSKKEKFQKVQFDYLDNKIFSIKVLANTSDAFSTDYQIPYRLDSTEMPVLFEQYFDYDEKGNLIEQNQFLNGEQVVKIKYEIVYY